MLTQTSIETVVVSLITSFVREVACSGGVCAATQTLMKEQRNITGRLQAAV